MKAINLKIAGGGRAYQAVAQSTAIAIQDATDYLRAMNTISSTAAGIGIAMVIAGNSKGVMVIEQAVTIGTAGVAQFAACTSAAITVATNYPASFS